MRLDWLTHIKEEYPLDRGNGIEIVVRKEKREWLNIKINLKIYIYLVLYAVLVLAIHHVIDHNFLANL